MTNDRTDRAESATPANARIEPGGGGSFPIVGVGASAGGLEAFTQFLKQLPLDTGMGFVLVQHLDPLHESALTQLLARATSLPVREVTNNLRVDANHIYVIPPDTNLVIAHGILKLQPRPKTRTPLRSIDFFFESLAQDQRERAIGVILSGTATDGTLGLEAIKAEGGITFAQDESARYDSMPRSAVAAGCVDFVLSPEHIAHELARIAKHPYVAGQPPEQLTPEDDRASATAHEDDTTPLPSGGHGTPRTESSKARAEATRGRETGSKDAENGFRKILLLLRNHSGADFSLYKSATIQRRIARRMVLEKQNTLEGYAQFLRGNIKELNALYSDVLISVTSFFRNPEAFDVLERKVFPKLLQQRGDEPLRVWVLGCSTGQEAYSIAMAFVEASEKASRLRKLQVFATDLNDALLDKARQGLYARTLARDISADRLRRFFVEEEGGYRINKALREMVVFARQNLISDPPFSRMDLISCRNLLIYLEPSLQKKAFPTFHYALKPEGFLFLGASESIGNFTDLFEPADKKNKIYCRKAAPTAAFQLPVRTERGGPPSSGPKPPSPLSTGKADVPEAVRGELDAQREADRVAANQFAPSGVLVNAALQILQFRGATSAYLEPPTGKASFDVLKMAREGLMLPLRAAINKAERENNSARKENVRVQQDGQTRTVNVEVIPLKNLRERCFLILFEDAAMPGRAAAPSPPASAPRAGLKSARPAAKEASRRIAELETDLTETRDYLQSVQEQHEAANEELQAANEEVQSANEELQSINEELETSKEELESSNEELTTVNDEMTSRNAELNRLNGDLTNLQASTKLAIVVLGRDLTIRRFSAQAEKQFNLLAGDVGRFIGNVRHHLVFTDSGGAADSPDATIAVPLPREHRSSARRTSAGTGKSPTVPSQASPDLESLIAEVIASVREREREVRDRDGRWFSLRVRPYFTHDNKVDGAVLVLVEIDALKRSEQAIAAARDHAEAIIRTTRDPLLILNPDLRIHTANEAFYRTFKVSPAQSEGRLIYDLGNREWDIPQLRHLLEDIVPRNNFFDDFEVTHEFESVGRRTMLLNARTLGDDSGAPERILLGIHDITERKLTDVVLRASEERYRILFASAPMAVFVCDRNGVIQYYNQRAAQLWGREPACGVEQHCGSLRLWLPDGTLLPHTQSPIVEVLRTGAPAPNVEVFIERPDGSRLPVLVNFAALKNEQGEVTGAITSFMDISERKQAEEALREAGARYRFLAESMPQKMFTAQPNGDVDYFNPQWMAFTGLTFDEIRDWGWTQFIHPDDLAENLRIWRQSVDTGEPFHFEHRFRRADGEYRWHLSRAVAFKDAVGKILMWVGSNTDIHEVKEADRHKDEFLALLAHELRGPLAPLSNMLEIMNRAGGNGEVMQQAGSTMARQLSQMTRLIDDLLDVSRISQGTLALRLDQIELASVIHQALEACRPALDSARHELTVTLPPQPVYLHADSTRLAQVFGNLLNNAAKFSDPGGRIALTVEHQCGEAIVSVKDTGIGIPPGMLPKVFEMFAQVDQSLERSRGGLGIGLTLVRQLVEMHGGSIEGFSEGLGRGSEFVVRLPGVLEHPEPQVQAPAATGATATPGRRILVVDDNRDSAGSLALLLKMTGNETHVAHDGLEAIDAAATFRPDVVLLDIGLPGLNGYDAARRIREQPWGKGIVLVALTGWSQPEDRMKSKDAGFDGHLVKPVNYDVLAQLLAEIPNPD